MNNRINNELTEKNQLNVCILYYGIKGCFKGFRFHLQLCCSGPATRPACSRMRPAWPLSALDLARDSQAVACDPCDATRVLTHATRMAP